MQVQIIPKSETRKKKFPPKKKKVRDKGNQLDDLLDGISFHTTDYNAKSETN